MHNTQCGCAECQISKSQVAAVPPPPGRFLDRGDGQQLFVIDAVVNAYSVDGTHYFQDAKLALASASRTPREIKLIEATMLVDKLEYEDRIKLLGELARGLAQRAADAPEGGPLAALAHLALAMAILVGN